MSTAFQWATTEDGTEPPANVYCVTRDIAIARLDSFRPAVERIGMTANRAALVAAIAGELTNTALIITSAPGGTFPVAGSPRPSQIRRQRSSSLIGAKDSLDP